MSNNASSLIERLRSLIPLDSLSDEGLDEVCRQIRIKTLPRKTGLFRSGDEDDRTIFLLSGTVQLDSGDRVESVAAGTDKSRYALANLKPRRYTATATTDIEIAEIDAGALDKILTLDQVAKGPPSSGYQVEELTDATDDTGWMIQTIRTPAFLRLPAGNIQALFANFEELSVSKGQVIIREGDPGDYFYLIKHGRCQVSRRPPGDGDTEVVFDHMEDGDSFGEDALVSGNPRNATITMLTDGSLMRLSKARFDQLMKQPLLTWIDADEAAALLGGDVGFLDVRMENEFEQGSLRGSHNLPLYLLRHKTSELQTNQSYVVFCDTGARSAAAAFLLAKEGFDVRVVRNGLAAMPGKAFDGPA